MSFWIILFFWGVECDTTLETTRSELQSLSQTLYAFWFGGFDSYRMEVDVPKVAPIHVTWFLGPIHVDPSSKYVANDHQEESPVD